MRAFTITMHTPALRRGSSILRQTATEGNQDREGSLGATAPLFGLFGRPYRAIYPFKTF